MLSYLHFWDDINGKHIGMTNLKSLCQEIIIHLEIYLHIYSIMMCLVSISEIELYCMTCLSKRDNPQQFTFVVYTQNVNVR